MEGFENGEFEDLINKNQEHCLSEHGSPIGTIPVTMKEQKKQVERLMAHTESLSNKKTFFTRLNLKLLKEELMLKAS